MPFIQKKAFLDIYIIKHKIITKVEYDILTKLNINKFSNNCLMYAKNNELYYSIPLTLYGKAHELDVTINSAQPI